MFGWGSSSKKPEDPKSDEAEKKLTDDERQNVLKIFQDDSKDNTKSKGLFGGFDPSGLERAAKAARELQELKYADEAIQIAKSQESTKQAEATRDAEANRAKQKAFEAEKVRMQEEERRKTIDAESQARQQNAYYQDQLARKRHGDQLTAQRQMRDEDLRKQEESQMRIESLRRQTAEYEANIRKQTEQARAEAESKGRIEQERKNWDLHMQRARLEQQEFRTTVIEGIQEAGTIFGRGFRDYLSDREKLATTVGIVTLTALGIYTARVSTRVVGNLVEARLSQPPLIRETSRLSVTNFLTKPFSTVANKISTYTSSADPSRVMENIVLEQSVHDRLEKFIVSTKNTTKNNAPFRNMLLHGPPGTGKTLFAKQLAKKVNMNYSIMTGSDVLPLGKNGVTEIHKLFDWAESSSKGMVLFVDEAETFLRKRVDTSANATGMSEESRNALNAFLYRTGTSSKKFLVVFATNQPDQLDWAVNDRTDELVEFSLPQLPERLKMLKLYFDKYIINGHLEGAGLMGGPKKISLEDPESMQSEAMMQKIAKRLEGFSGREISKLVIAWQANARGTMDCVLSLEDMMSVVDQRVKQHALRLQWEQPQPMLKTPQTLKS